MLSKDAVKIEGDNGVGSRVNGKRIAVVMPYRLPGTPKNFEMTVRGYQSCRQALVDDSVKTGHRDPLPRAGNYTFAFMRNKLQPRQG